MFDENLSNKTLFKAHTNAINRIKQSPFTNGYVATASKDTTIKIWNPNTNWTLIKNYTEHLNEIYSLEWINDDTLASGSSDTSIHIWSISKGETRIKIFANDVPMSLKLLSNGMHMACGLANGNINIYNTSDGVLISSLQGHDDGVNDLELVSDGSLLASFSWDNSILIWNLTTRAQKFTLLGHTDAVFGLKRISSDILVSGSLDTKLIMWNTTSGNIVRTLFNHTSEIRWSLDLLNDGQTLVSGSKDQSLKLWDWKTGKCLKTVNTSLEIFSLSAINLAKSIEEEEGKLGIYFV